MKSLRELYRIGRGPSSSHTMGPDRAAEIFKSEHPDAERYRVTLYGSLAKTGRGHMTGKALLDRLGEDVTEIVFDPDSAVPHPNTLDLEALRGGTAYAKMRAYSVGGGALKIEGRPEDDSPEVYPESSFEEISSLCKRERMRLSDYVELREGPEIWDYLLACWRQMRRTIDEGLSVTGVLPGGLNVERKAQYLIGRRHIDESSVTRENRIVCAYAFAAAEQNAASGVIVTAPTCGSCGVLPSALRFAQEQKGFSEMQMARALAAGGVIGNLIKTNASISGAECGCQAEIGAACSMCAAALSALHEMGLDQIECAAEMAMEHHLGLTCDPINGLVQIPCIERNAVAAMRAINALSLANFLTGLQKMPFDTVVKTMYQTGKDMHRIYRETAEGGLAKFYESQDTP